MPKILQINSCANWGSTGKIAEQINQFLSSKGWETYFAYGGDVNPSKSKLIRIGNNLSRAIALLEARLFDNAGLSSRVATLLFIRRIKKIKPDIIHIHNLHAYYINYRILFNYLNKTKIPVVWTLHDCWSFTGHCGHFITAGCEKWKTECHNCPLKKYYPASVLLDKSTRNFRLKKRLFTGNENIHLVVVSEWLKHLVQQSFFCNTDIRVVNNGVDIDVFKPLSSVPKNRRYRVLGVSSVWTENKGLYEFFKIRQLLDKSKYEVLLVGLSKEQIKALPDGITGVERTNSQLELVNYYSSSDIFINPTIEDTFPTTNMEALACGLPVVTYRTGGSPEIVSADTGRVVEQGDILSIVRCVNDICESRDELIRENCRKRAELFYDKNKSFLSYVDIYHKISELSNPEGGGGIIIAVASTWSEIKGLSYYLQLNELLKNGEKLILVGVSESLKRELPDSIICLPRMSSVYDLVYLYNNADVVISLSEAETFGMTIVEGFACGIPAVVFNNAALPELITKETGFVVPKGNIDELYYKIQEIIAKGKSYYLKACRQHAVEKYSIYHQNSESFNLYEQVL